MLYAGLMTVVAAIMLWAITNRSILEVSVLPDRNPLFVVLSDGSLRNNYTVKILNKLHDVRSFRLTADGLPGAKLAIMGFERRAARHRRGARQPPGAEGPCHRTARGLAEART